LTPPDLKLGVTDALNALLEPIRQEFANSPEFQKAFELAYPKPGKKVKKVKDKGSKYPGANPMKTAKDSAGVQASERIAEDIITNGQVTGGVGPSEERVQSAGESVEEALKTLNVSDIPK
jgi:hypothetical protein